MKLPTGGFSRPFPAYHGLADDLKKEERSNRGPAMGIPTAPPDIQDLFDLHTHRLAIRLGFKTASDYILQALGGVVFHYTLNFMGGHSFDHNDEPFNDGPGWWIWNLVLQGSGLLYYLEESARQNGVKLPMSGVWQHTGDCAGFSGDARIFMRHGVLRSPPVTKLPSTAAELDTPRLLDNIRIVGSFRGGELPAEALANWYGQWSEAYAIPNPYLSEVLPVIGAITVKKEKTSKPKPRKSSRQLVPAVSAPSAGVGMLVLGDLAHLPQVGELLPAATNSTWDTCTVVKVTSNFVQTNALPRSGKQSHSLVLKAGMQVQVRLPLEDSPTTVHLLAVGIIYGRTKSASKYRAAVIRRRTGEQKAWGVLETLNASAFPDRADCNVPTRTHTTILVPLQNIH